MSPTIERQDVSPDTSEWTVDRLVFIGAVRDISGNLVNVLAFRADLRAGQTSCDIEVRVDARALARLLESMGPGAIREPGTIAKVVEGLLATALSSPGCTLDAQRVSPWEFGETSMASLAPEEA